MPRHAKNPDRPAPKQSPNYTHPDRQKPPEPQATRGGAHRGNSKGGKK